MGSLRLAAIALGALALLAATAPDVGIVAKVARESNDLLVPVTVSIAVRNPAPDTVTVSFLTTDIYEVTVRDEHTELYSSLFGHKPVIIERRLPFMPGTTPLVSFIWDGTTNDRRSLAPGSYTLHVGLVGSIIHPAADIPIAFATPLSFAQAQAKPPGTAVTVAGVMQIVDGLPTLVADDGTTLHVSRIVPHSQGRYIIRGYITKTGDTISVNVARAIPAFDNLDAVATPPPPRPLMTFPRMTPSPGSN